VKLCEETGILLKFLSSTICSPRIELMKSRLRSEVAHLPIVDRFRCKCNVQYVTVPRACMCSVYLVMNIRAVGFTDNLKICGTRPCCTRQFPYCGRNSLLPNLFAMRSSLWFTQNINPLPHIF
jgi:hypothetical protein